MGLVRRKYYVVEVEFFKGNFRHKAIYCHGGTHSGGEWGTLFANGYENSKDNVVLDRLHHFNVISEIKDMNT